MPISVTLDGDFHKSFVFKVDEVSRQDNGQDGISHVVEAQRRVVQGGAQVIFHLLQEAFLKNEFRFGNQFPPKVDTHLHRRPDLLQLIVGSPQVTGGLVYWDHEADNRQIWVHALRETLLRCFQEGLLPGELGVSWSVAGYEVRCSSRRFPNLYARGRDRWNAETPHKGLACEYERQYDK